MRKILFIILFLKTLNVSGQNIFEKMFSKITDAELNVQKTGPYFGIQQGKYTPFELGVERQFQKVKLINPRINSFNLGFNYDFRENVIGYNLGYWHQTGRLALTYGGNLVVRSNFDQYQFGVAPTIGFRLLQFHLQTGFNILTPEIKEIETNKLFISLRYTLITQRDFEKSKKKEEKISESEKAKENRDKLRQQAERERQKLR